MSPEGDVQRAVRNGILNNIPVPQQADQAAFRRFRFQLRARAEGRAGVFPRALPHVPRQAVVPPGDGVGLPGKRL